MSIAAFHQLAGHMSGKAKSQREIGLSQVRGELGLRIAMVVGQ
jgi:hypothetical protein